MRIKQKILVDTTISQCYNVIAAYCGHQVSCAPPIGSESEIKE